MAWTTKESFQFGQVDKRVLARETSDQSLGGCVTLTNGITFDSGSSKKRFGTQYKGQPATSTATARLFFFRITGVGDFIVEASNLKFRFWKDGVLQGAPYELTTPYATADLDAIQVVQTPSKLYLVHPDYMPRVLTRTTDTNWTLAGIDDTSGPWVELREQSASIQMATTKYGLIAGLFVTPIASENVFDDTTDTNALMFINNGWIRLSGNASNFTADGTSVPFSVVLDDVPDGATPSFEWEGPYREDGSETGSDITVLSVSGTYAVGEQVSLTRASGSLTFAASDEGAVMDIDSSGTARTQYVLIESVSSTTVAYGRIISGITGTGTGTDSRFLRAASPGNTIYMTWDETAGTLTASSDYFDAAHDDDGGALFYYQDGLLRVDTYNSATSVDVSVVRRPTSAAPTPFWRESAWNEVQKYPRAIELHQQRLWLGGQEGSPNTVNASKVASRASDYENFDLDDADASDALDFDLVTSYNEAIQWLISSGDLVVGTDFGEHIITSQGGAVTAADNSRVRQSTVGGSNVKAIQVGRFVIFVGRDGVSLYSLEYSELSQSNIAEELSKWSSDLFAQSGIKYLDYSRAPHPMILCLRSDGTAVSVSFNKDGNLLAPNKWTSGDSIESLVVAPGSAGDEVWMVVRRGSDYFIEVMDFTRQGDSGEVKTPSGADVTGLHFDDATDVRVWDIDAQRDLGEYTVTSGAIDLDSWEPDGDVEVALPISYENDAQLTVLQDQQGFSTGRKQLANELRLYLVNSHGGTVQNVSIPYTQKTPITGQIEMVPLHALGDTDRPLFEIRHNTLEPFEIARLVFSGGAHD